MISHMLTYFGSRISWQNALRAGYIISMLLIIFESFVSILRERLLILLQ